MSISGSLKTMNFAEILQWCKVSRKTGTLTVGRRGVKKEIYFEDGVIISAGSSDPGEYLGQRLLASASISEEQLKEAFETQRRTNVLLGRILVSRKLISEEELEKALHGKIMEMVFNLFLWKIGKFHFSDKVLSDRKRRVHVEVDVDACVFEGARRVDEWVRCRSVFPSDRTLLTVGKKKPPDPAGDPLKATLFEMAGQGRSIEEMYLETRADSLAVLSSLCELHRGGYVRAAGEKKVEKKPAPAPETAREFRDDAEETEWIYGNMLPREGVPSLAKDFTDMRDYTLSSKEAFVLSRINGRWDVRSIVMISPIREVEILRILRRLLEEKIIALG